MFDLAQFAIELFKEFNGEEDMLWNHIKRDRVVLIDFGEDNFIVRIVDKPVSKEMLVTDSGLKFVYFKSGEDGISFCYFS